MEPARHERPRTAETDPVHGETDESPVPPGQFWRKRTVDELAAEQGIAVPQSLDEMIGAAADLWDDDEDFDRFVQGIQDRRPELREGGEKERTRYPS